MKPSIQEFYFSPEGRVSRGQFWRDLVLPCFGFLLLATAATPPTFAGGLLALVVVGAVSIVPCVYVSLKRLHDMGFSGWFVLIGFIPYFGALILFFWIGFWPDGVGDNRYGPSPR